mgnify:CR=1 FL=1
MDVDLFGIDRGAVLAAWQRRTPDYAFVAKQAEEIVGYCLGRPGLNYETIGPVVALDGSIEASETEIRKTWTKEELNRFESQFVNRSDPDLRTAFDACDVCYGSKKGYRQEGDQMVCNNCGNRYPVDGLGTENKAGGGCWPGYLPSEVRGDTLVIKNSDLDAGKYRF